MMADENTNETTPVETTEAPAVATTPSEAAENQSAAAGDPAQPPGGRAIRWSGARAEHFRSGPVP